MSYTKLFASLITSTIWGENDTTRIVWITMLAIADRNGEVQASLPGLARLSGVSVEACEEAIIKFLSPDLHSRTKDDEGRRIEAIEGGWSLLNYTKYRELASKDERLASNAERQRRFKERKRRNGNAGNAGNGKGDGRVTHPRDIAEAEAEAEAKEKKKNSGATAPTKPADPRSKHPAIQTLRAIIGSYPNKANWDAMIDLLGGKPDEPKLRRCFEEWVGRGFKPVNILGWTGWYRDGIPDGFRQSTASNGTSTKSKARTDTVGAPSPEPLSCGKPARYIYTWPECEPAVCCEECLQNVKLSAEALNLKVAITAVQGEPSLCP